MSTIASTICKEVWSCIRWWSVLLGLARYQQVADINSMVYVQVGQAFSGNKTVTVAKMDATANDVPSNKFQVSYSSKPHASVFPCVSRASMQVTITALHEMLASCITMFWDVDLLISWKSCLLYLRDMPISDSMA